MSLKQASSQRTSEPTSLLFQKIALQKWSWHITKIKVQCSLFGPCIAKTSALFFHKIAFNPPPHPKKPQTFLEGNSVLQSASVNVCYTTIITFCNFRACLYAFFFEMKSSPATAGRPRAFYMPSTFRFSSSR